MANGKYQVFCTDIMNHFLLGSSETVATTADVRIALVTTTPSATAVGTELSASNYSAGGIACGFGTPVEGNPTTTDNDAQIQWDNSGGGAWTQVTGCVVHRGGGTLALATAMYYLDGLTIDVGADQTLTIAAGDLDVTEQ
jgi:hypothetical protein